MSQSQFEPPRQTSKRDYNPPDPSPDSPPPEIPLTPQSPRERLLLESFKQSIAQHISNMKGKTTGDFINDLSLELWQLTRNKRDIK